MRSWYTVIPNPTHHVTCGDQAQLLRQTQSYDRSTSMNYTSLQHTTKPWMTLHFNNFHKAYPKVCIHLTDHTAVTVCNAEKSSKKEKESKAPTAEAEAPSAGQARQLKAELKRAKAAEAERKAKGSYTQVPVQSCQYCSSSSWQWGMQCISPHSTAQIAEENTPYYS
jgi:hypothetical protein